MIGRVNTGGGGGKINILISGGVGETITYTGPMSGNVELDATGHGALNGLPKGNYSFTGSKTGYNRVYGLKSNCQVNVHPDGAIYWCGRTFGHVLVNKNGEYVVRDTDIEVHSNHQSATGCFFGFLVDTTGKTKLVGQCIAGNGASDVYGGSYLMLGNDGTTMPSTSSTGVRASTDNVNIASSQAREITEIKDEWIREVLIDANHQQSRIYVGVNMWGSGSYASRAQSWLYALWLE